MTGQDFEATTDGDTGVDRYGLLGIVDARRAPRAGATPAPVQGLDRRPDHRPSTVLPPPWYCQVRSMARLPQHSTICLCVYTQYHKYHHHHSWRVTIIRLLTSQPTNRPIVPTVVAHTWIYTVLVPPFFSLALCTLVICRA